MGLGIYELFVKVAWLQNEHLPLYKKDYNGTVEMNIRDKKKKLKKKKNFQ